MVCFIMLMEFLVFLYVFSNIIFSISKTRYYLWHLCYSVNFFVGFFYWVKRLCYTTDNWQWGSKNVKIVVFALVSSIKHGVLYFGIDR